MLFVPGLLILEGLLSSNETRNIGMGEGGGGVGVARGQAMGTLTNDNGEGSENVTKKWIRAVSNFVALIPTVLICQMLVILSRRVEF